MLCLFEAFYAVNVSKFYAYLHTIHWSYLHELVFYKLIYVYVKNFFTSAHIIELCFFSVQLPIPWWLSIEVKCGYYSIECVFLTITHCNKRVIKVVKVAHMAPVKCVTSS